MYSLTQRIQRHKWKRKISEVEKCVPKVQCNIRQILSVEHEYMIHSFLNGDYSTIQMAYKKFRGLEIEQNLPHIVFKLKD